MGGGEKAEGPLPGGHGHFRGGLGGGGPGEEGGDDIDVDDEGDDDDDENDDGGNDDGGLSKISSPADANGCG